MTGVEYVTTIPEITPLWGFGQAADTSNDGLRGAQRGCWYGGGGGAPGAQTGSIQGAGSDSYAPGGTHNSPYGGGGGSLGVGAIGGIRSPRRGGGGASDAGGTSGAGGDGIIIIEYWTE
jgi:hypothetical protein